MCKINTTRAAPLLSLLHVPGSIPAPLAIHSNCLGPNSEEDGQLAAQVRPIQSNFRLFLLDKKARAFERAYAVSQ
jgi:hypothetical protein